MTDNWDESLEPFTLLPSDIEFIGQNDPHNSTWESDLAEVFSTPLPLSRE